MRELLQQPLLFCMPHMNQVGPHLPSIRQVAIGLVPGDLDHVEPSITRSALTPCTR